MSPGTATIAADSDRGWVRRRPVNPALPPSTLEQRGVRIHFPFKTYECQEAYAKKALEVLWRGEKRFWIVLQKLRFTVNYYLELFGMSVSYG